MPGSCPEGKNVRHRNLACRCSSTWWWCARMFYLEEIRSKSVNIDIKAYATWHPMSDRYWLAMQQMRWQPVHMFRGRQRVSPQCMQRMCLGWVDICHRGDLWVNHLQTQHLPCGRVHITQTVGVRCTLTDTACQIHSHWHCVCWARGVSRCEIHRCWCCLAEPVASAKCIICSVHVHQSLCATCSVKTAYIMWPYLLMLKLCWGSRDECGHQLCCLF